ncbi:MAG TPA: MltR family transcriptional regulator [Rhizomicrobium sp.]
MLNLEKTQDDRTLAIVGACFVEDYLQDAIISRLRSPLSKRDIELLFNHDGPLERFSSKIRLGYGLALFGYNARADLDRLRTIRNHFAHQAFTSEFTHPHISKLCTQLKAPDEFKKRGGKSGVSMRQRFLDTVYGLAGSLAIVANDPNPPSEPNPSVQGELGLLLYY